MAQTAQDEFEAVKKQFRKTDGRNFWPFSKFTEFMMM